MEACFPRLLSCDLVAGKSPSPNSCVKQGNFGWLLAYPMVRARLNPQMARRRVSTNPPELTHLVEEAPDYCDSSV